ncbi:unnamed protein product [Cylicocyclus nassatus]|uniref:Fungal lipase-type domain-containing protein n=1 Tax=Cylicocyclus nassatus TaxID=53992 RepID=A0AA36GTY1_CYLNA|nr:unnamed protein product [Cylicocyclus nassatus]
MLGLIATLSLVVVGAQSQADSFSDNFARNKMLPLAAAAYSDKPGECVGRLGGNVVKFYRADCSGFGFVKVFCSAYTALLKKEKAIVLSFRGTDNNWQLIKELVRPFLTKEWFGGASVNQYFLLAFNNLFKSSMYQDVKKLIHDKKYKNFDIWITGHSLGGALASLTASYLLETGDAERSRTKLMTFGQPRTGDRIFAERLNDKIDYAFRVIHDNDLVTQIPPNLPKLRYHHHKKEVYYGRSMENGIFKVCKTDETCTRQFEPAPELLDQTVHRNLVLLDEKLRLAKELPSTRLRCSK